MIRYSMLYAKAKEFVSYWLAADESTGRTDTAQLSIFIQGVDAKFAVTEELLDLKSIQLLDRTFSQKWSGASTRQNCSGINSLG